MTKKKVVVPAQYNDWQVLRDNCSAQAGSIITIPSSLLRESNLPVFTALCIRIPSQIRTELSKCSLPTGWKLRLAKNKLTFEIADKKGRRRADIFFNNDLPCITLTHRVTTRVWRENNDTAYGEVLDGERVIYRSKGFGYCKYYQFFTAEREATSEAEAWANKNFPKHKDFLAYWDVDELITANEAAQRATRRKRA